MTASERRSPSGGESEAAMIAERNRDPLRLVCLAIFIICEGLGDGDKSENEGKPRLAAVKTTLARAPWPKSP